MKPKQKLSDLRMKAGEFDKVMRSVFAVSNPPQPVKKVGQSKPTKRKSQ